MAKRSTTEIAFSAIRIEGGLLAADFLGRVARFDAKGQAEADYDIPKGLKLRDEIGRYWKISLNLWQEFQAGRQRTDHDAYSFTSKDFLEPFCRHVLGFTDLEAVGQVTLDERIFPIGYQALAGQVPLVFAAYTVGLEQSDARFGDGHRRRSPFLLAQEYLNAEDQCLWAIVSNGLKLRILRDNPSLTRPAYIEVDLESIFNEERYPDFTAFWLLAHATRFGSPQAARSGHPVDCHLERWRNTSQESGIRARERLRDGVGEALRALGTGFASHSKNTALREQLDSGALTPQAYYEQLLRLIYRLIFLATLEDRQDEQRGTPLVFAPDADESAQELYLRGYSLNRLRDHAAKRRHYDRYSDLWQGLGIAFAGLVKGQPALGLPALGGLFTAEQCPHLDGAQLENRFLLQAVFGLCFFREGAALTRVNYRDMGSEELGSVYESLLELVPVVSVSVGSRRLVFVGDEEEDSTIGNARKTSGSYYTPDSLVQELIKSALEPVIAQTLQTNQQQPVKALLELTVCDPACGSGHFLLAAARRIAEEVARLSASEGNPLQSDYRHALRDVIAHCIYGVDKNPMAVELAKTALWLEAYTPDRPLTFLDHHFRCGNALLGVLDPAILANGIPNEAFNALASDDKDVVKMLKKANKDALKAIEKSKISSRHMLSLRLGGTAENHSLEALPDDTLDAIAAKRAAFAQAEAHAAQSRVHIAADLFVAAFMLPKTTTHQSLVPTSQDLWLVMNGSAPRPGVQVTATQAAQDSQALHWHLAFPYVFSRGGFDCILGNPPWEIVQARDSEVDDDRLGREKLWFGIGIFSVLSGRRDLYKLFVVLTPKLLKSEGRCGFVLPIGFMFEDDCSELRKYLFDQGSVISVLHIQNRQKRFFRDVHASYRFLAITLTPARIETHRFSAVVNSPADLVSPPWYDVHRGQFDTVLGEERSAILFNDLTQASLHQSISACLRQHPLLRYHVVAEFHASSDKTLLSNHRVSETDWTLLKNGSFHHFHPCFGPTEKFVPLAEVQERLIRKGLAPEIWMTSPRLVFRDIARNDDSRTLISCLIPPGYISTYDAPMVVPNRPDQQVELHLAFYTGYLTTFLADFLIRPFVDKHIKGYVLARVPIPEFDPTNHKMQRAAELSLGMANSSWRTCATNETPDSFNRNYSGRLELDALWLNIAGVQRVDAELIFDYFESIKADEMREFGEYRTARLVLREFDRMALADAAHEPYLSLLVPPPGQPSSTQYSPIGIIRDEDDARMAGLVLAIIRQAGALSRQSLTLALTAAHMSGATTVTLTQAELDQLAAYRQSHQSMLLPARFERTQLMLRFFEDAGAIRIEQQGAWIAVAPHVPLPAGVIVEQGTEEIVGILLRTVRASLERQSADDLGTASQLSTKRA
ncbi:Type II restriction endonuclease [Candidatus Nitrotoga sp. HW29]|uniref:Eco57I restriction-modification methylase domain-containing protein n=1 Tax=Candidatus Nitrotoga sp. HW29 TaxID=2886963 RepID=UPI001EF34D11|nr:N-6 DNA methylase [Candidatus Nitrotoga sp. HW29]CAH1906110.1 Type II restriction endonuclease [Candidatus Nitrotoga sp. HW29]